MKFQKDRGSGTPPAKEGPFTRSTWSIRRGENEGHLFGCGGGWFDVDDDLWHVEASVLEKGKKTYVGQGH